MAIFSNWRLRLGLRATSVVALGVFFTTATPSRALEQWTGAASTDWVSAGHWSAGVPTSSTRNGIDRVTANATVIGVAGAQATRLRVGVFGCRQRYADHPQRRRFEQCPRLCRQFFRLVRDRDGGWRRLNLDQ